MPHEVMTNHIRSLLFIQMRYHYQPPHEDKPKAHEAGTRRWYPTLYTSSIYLNESSSPPIHHNMLALTIMCFSGSCQLLGASCVGSSLTMDRAHHDSAVELGFLH
mmetsp:Transcript_13760/g.24937  ORF Transcript_13760/g.24937 Transcript_13760/m.24937 type:complete len:105 (+) Transcript_13760:1529-1843(+)